MEPGARQRPRNCGAAVRRTRSILSRVFRRGFNEVIMHAFIFHPVDRAPQRTRQYRYVGASATTLLLRRGDCCAPAPKQDLLRAEAPTNSLYCCDGAAIRFWSVYICNAILLIVNLFSIWLFGRWLWTHRRRSRWRSRTGCLLWLPEVRLCAFGEGNEPA